MRLTWHIIWKDLRAERWGLLFWVTLYVAQIVFGLVAFHHDGVDRDFLDATWLGNVMMVAAQFFMAYLLVVRMVQEDAITGTRMFWLTRPIGPGRLLRAKAWSVVLLFVLLPALLKAPWWIYCGFTARDVLWAAVETMGWQLLLVAPAFLIASFTEDFGRTLMWGLLLVVFLFGGALLLYSRQNLPEIVAGVYRLNNGLLFTKLWLTGALLILGSAVVAAHQFQTRRFARSMALAVPMVLLALVAGRLWPWDCTVLLTQINDPKPVQEIAGNAYPALQLTAGTAQVLDREHQETYGGIPSTPRTWIWQTMELRGLPEGWVLGTVKLRQSWNWPDAPASVEGPATHFSEWSYRQLHQILAMPAPQGDVETARWFEAQYAARRARGEFAVPGFTMWQPRPRSADGRVTLFGRTLVPDTVIARIRTQAPVGDARVDVELGRPRKLFELPLKRGATWAGASLAYRLGQLGARQEHKANLQLLAARPAVRENGLWWADAIDRPYRRQYSQDLGFVVPNRSNNTIGSASQSGEMSKSGRIVIGGVVLQWNTLNVHSARVIRNGEWVQCDPDWIEHSTLALIGPSELVRLKREVKVEKYEFQPGPFETGEGAKKTSDPL